MLDQLIKEGEALESEAQHGMVGKFFTGVNFEKWASKVMIYLEKNHKDSAVTERAKKAYQKLTADSYKKYEFLLGTLKAIKESD